MTSKKATIDFSLQEFIFTSFVTWEFHVDESNNGRYDSILGRDLLTAMGLDLKFFDNIITIRILYYMVNQRML